MPSAIRKGALLAALVVASFAMPDESAAQVTPNIPPPADVRQGEATTPERRVGGLRPGDLLVVTVFREKELSGEFLVDPRGYVQIPGAGSVQVAGLEPQQAQERVSEALRARGIDREVALQARVRVSVLGEVRQPQVFPTEPGTTLLQLLTLAGGPTERANLRATRVVRDGRVFVVDLESGLAGGAAGRVVLYSGDYVIVPRRTGFTRESFSLLTSIIGAAASITAAVVTLTR